MKQCQIPPPILKSPISTNWLTRASILTFCLSSTYEKKFHSFTLGREIFLLYFKIPSFFKADKDGKNWSFFHNIMFCKQTLLLVFEKATFFNKNVLNNRLLIFLLQLFYCLFWVLTHVENWIISNFYTFQRKILLSPCEQSE